MDLEHLLEYGEWLKIRTLSANEFLKNNEHFDYCMTPGCEQINRIRQNNIGGVDAEYMKCDICKSSYCLSCNVPIFSFRALTIQPGPAKKQKCQKMNL
jgi:hypothetical protein